MQPPANVMQRTKRLPMTKVMIGFMTFASCDEPEQILMMRVLNFKLSDSITTYRLTGANRSTRFCCQQPAIATIAEMLPRK